MCIRQCTFLPIFCLFFYVWFVFRYQYEMNTISLFWKFLVKPTILRCPFDMNMKHNPIVKWMPWITFCLMCNLGIRWRKWLLALGCGHRGSIWANLGKAPLTVMYFPGWYMGKTSSSTSTKNKLPEKNLRDKCRNKIVVTRRNENIEGIMLLLACVALETGCKVQTEPFCVLRASFRHCFACSKTHRLWLFVPHLRLYDEMLQACTRIASNQNPLPRRLPENQLWISKAAG